MCLNSGISSTLKQNNPNVQAFIDKSFDDVLPKFRQRAKYLQDFYLTFSTLLKILHKISKIPQKGWDNTKNNVLTVECGVTYSVHAIHLASLNSLQLGLCT